MVGFTSLCIFWTAPFRFKMQTASLRYSQPTYLLLAASFLQQQKAQGQCDYSISEEETTHRVLHISLHRISNTGSRPKPQLTCINASRMFLSSHSGGLKSAWTRLHPTPWPHHNFKATNAPPIGHAPSGVSVVSSRVNRSLSCQGCPHYGQSLKFLHAQWPEPCQRLSPPPCLPGCITSQPEPCSLEVFHAICVITVPWCDTKEACHRFLDGLVLSVSCWRL